MTGSRRERGGTRRRRTYRHAWLLGAIAVAIYFGYVALMVANGAGSA